MTVYALRLQNATDTAARVRMADLLGLTPTGNLSARGGVRPGPTAADVAVTAGTMNVTVQPFLALIDGGVSDTQGGYPFVCDAVVTLTLANGHATLSRTDVVAAVVRDNAFDSGGSTTATVEVIAGTPGAGVPALPTNALPLRNVVVPAGASTGTGGLSSGALSTDRRTYVSGLGGVVTVATQAERDALPTIVGTVVYRKDIDQLEVRGTSAWRSLQDDTGWADLAVVPGWTIAANGAKIRRFNGVVYITAHVAKATWAPGDGVADIPAGYRPTVTQVATAYSGHLVRITSVGGMYVDSAPAGGGLFVSLSYPV